MTSRKTVKIGKDCSTGYDEWYCEWYRCPNCSSVNITHPFKYCPTCGIKLEWED